MKNLILLLLLTFASAPRSARSANESYPLHPYASFAISASNGEICEALSSAADWISSKFRRTEFSREAYNKMSLVVQREFPLMHPRSKQRPPIQRRHRYFMAMLKFGRFSSPEELIAGTDHFLGNKEFTFGRWLGMGEDVFIDDSTAVETRRRFMKLKTSLYIDQKMPRTEEEYLAWLVSLLRGAHLHLLNRELNSISTVPFTKEGSIPWGENSYRKQVEAKVSAVNGSFYAFFDRVARVMPEIEQQLPPAVERGAFSRAWQQFRLFIWPKASWKWVQQNSLNYDRAQSWVPWGHYFMSWVSENTLRVGVVVSAISSISFATYVYQNFSWQDLRDIDNGKQPEFVTQMAEDQADIQTDFVRRRETSAQKKQKEISELRTEILQLEDRLSQESPESRSETEVSLRKKRERLRYLERY